MTTGRLPASWQSPPSPRAATTAEKVGNVTLVREMAKDKNALACSRVFHYIASRPGKKEVMLLMNSLTDVPHWSENVCWFYDTDFEYLADESIVRVVCTRPAV